MAFSDRISQAWKMIKELTSNKADNHKDFDFKKPFDSTMIGLYGTELIGQEGAPFNYGSMISSIQHNSRGFQIGGGYHDGNAFYRGVHYSNNEGQVGFGKWFKFFTDGNSPLIKSNNGYTKFPNGLIIQWGEIYLTNVTTQGQQFNFPTSFNGNVSATITVSNNGQRTAIQMSPSLSTFTLWNVESRIEHYARWIAIGY